MPAPTRRGLFSLLLAGLGWLFGRRVAGATPVAATAPAAPGLGGVFAAPLTTTFSCSTVTFVYEGSGQLVQCPDRGTLCTYTYDGPGGHLA